MLSASYCLLICFSFPESCLLLALIFNILVLQVYFAGVGRLKNIRAALCRGRSLKCTRCERPGATIGCRVDRCPRTYHLVCYYSLSGFPFLTSDTLANKLAAVKLLVYHALTTSLWCSVFCSLVHELMVASLITVSFSLLARTTDIISNPMVVNVKSG